TAHVFAAAKQQCRFMGVGVAFNVADKDDVVAAVMPILVAALEMRSRPDQHRGAAFGDYMVDLGELVLMGAGEFIRQFDLVVRQHIDDEMRTLLKGRKALRVERGAPQHERRRQRYRSERVGGQPVKPAVAAARRDDRYTGRKGAKCVAEVAQIEAVARGALHRRRMAAGQLASGDLVRHSSAPSKSRHSGASGGSPSATLPYIAPFTSQLST